MNGKKQKGEAGGGEEEGEAQGYNTQHLVGLSSYSSILLHHLCGHMALKNANVHYLFYGGGPSCQIQADNDQGVCGQMHVK